MPIYGESRVKVSVCSGIKSFQLLCSKSCVSVFQVLSATKYNTYYDNKFENAKRDLKLT